MIVVNPQYITDAAGEKSMVILPVKEFEAMMEVLEDLEDFRFNDEAKMRDNRKTIQMNEVFTKDKNSDSKHYILSEEQEQILNERLMEDKSSFIPARELLNQLKKKHGL